MKRLNKKGETLVEVLVAVLIMASCTLMLCTGVISSARINKKVKDSKTDMDLTNIQSESSAVVNIIHEDGSKSSMDVNLVQTTNGYYYYEVK